MGSNGNIVMSKAHKSYKWEFWLCVFVVAYSSIYFFNTYPISEGWGVFYSELLYQGKVPYKDFYYYLPPLNLLIDAIFWKLSFGYLLIFRAWRLLERLIIFVLQYRLLKRYFPAPVVFLSCIITVVLATADVYDLIGDYNQTGTLLMVILAHCAVRFVDSEESSGNKMVLFWIGIVLGLMLLLKQSVFAASFLFYFIALAFYCYKQKNTKFIQYCLIIAVGVLTPVAIASIYLLTNHAMVPFIEQVFLNVDGKGSLSSIIFSSILSLLRNRQMWVLTLISLYFFSCKSQRECNERKELADSSKERIIIGVIFFLLITIFFDSELKNLFHVFKVHWVRSSMVIGSFLLYVSVLYIGRAFKNKVIKYIKSGALVIFIFCIGYALFVGDNYMAKSIYNQTGVFQKIQGSLLYIVTYGVLLTMVTCCRKLSEKKAQALFYISVGSFAGIYSCIMASGSSFPSARAFHIGLPLLLCVVFAQGYIFNRKTFLQVVTIVSVAILSIVTVCQKVECSYAWWGSYMLPVSEKKYTTDIQALSGVYMSANQKEMYEMVTELIEENSTEDAVVWGYPHNKLFNILTNRYKMDSFVPVLFYDVVADKYVEKEKKLLEQNLPDVVVWQEIPGCIEAHEGVFREGEPLKQRDIIAMFQKLFLSRYTMLGSYGDVSVYALIGSEHIID